MPKPGRKPNVREPLTTCDAKQSSETGNSLRIATVRPPLDITSPCQCTKARGVAILFTGLSGAGKTSIAHDLGRRLNTLGLRVTILDGDDFRAHFSSDLGFSRSDREANLRRAALIASEVVKHGGIALCSFIAPYQQTRQEARQIVEKHGTFVEVHVSTPIEECEKRDPKGLYRRARLGLISCFTGISDVYEPPARCELAIDTSNLCVSEAVDQVMRSLAQYCCSASFWLASTITLLHPRVPSEAEGIQLAAGSRKGEEQCRLFQRIIIASSERRTSVTDVARTVGIDRHALAKNVKVFTGQSFLVFHRSLLLERARLLLRQDRVVKEIAFELGFATPQSFHRFIRKTSGVTPLALRHIHQV